MNNHKILFILKKSYNYSEHYSYKRSGLLNSASFIEHYLHKELYIDTKLVTVHDGNSIDKEVHHYKPTLVIIEAIWCPPYKLKELTKIYPHIKWIIRIHSKTPFLAHEGTALNYIHAYNKIDNVFLSFNSFETNEDYKKIGIRTIFLPNIYYHLKDESRKYVSEYVESYFNEKVKEHHAIHVGCFGAIRPMKNQLTQAIAAIRYADKNNKKLYFHINGTRIEQKGDGILKNLRNLFLNSKHELIEWEWLEHKDFVYLVKKMTFGMQVSLSESFNIVTADFVENNIPIIVSKDIEWMPQLFTSNPLKINNILFKLGMIMNFKKIVVRIAKRYLEIYNCNAKQIWKEFLWIGFHDL